MSRIYERGDEFGEWIRSLPGRWGDWYHVPILGAVVVFMLWVRLQAYENFIVDGRVFFSGNDAYYHFREVMYVVTHWPWTMPFDPWTYFPYGTEQGQFGTLFDQLIATAALIVGLGSPSEHLVAQVHLVAPAVFGALVALPLYGIGKRLDGKAAGVAAALVIAILPGTFLTRTLVGFPDHNSAEPLFQVTAVLATIIAIQVAEREKPVLELLLDGDWKGLRTPVGWGVVAGLTTFMYVMVWPPAVFFVGILGIFYVIALSLDVLRGRSPEPVAFVGAVSMVVVFLLSAVRLDTLAFASTRISLIHLLLSLGVAVGCLFMAGLARLWDSRSLPTVAYPVTVSGLLLFGAVLTSVVLPDFFGTIRSNLTRIFAFGQSDTALTVAEAQSVFTSASGDAGAFTIVIQFMQSLYGLAFVTAAVGLVWMLVRLYRREEHTTATILIAVWAVASTLMALTQVRFNYYLASVVAVLTAYLVARVFAFLDLRTIEDVREVKGYQLLVVLTLFIVIVGPLAPVVSGSNVVDRAQRNGPGASVDWGDSLDWMEGNTPPEGLYGGADNRMAYYGSYQETEDFEYPEGAYGVMSWWDYGHWITVMGERIPNANPFQQGPHSASAFLQAPNETRANLILEALPSTSNPQRHSNEELRSMVADQSAQQAHEDTRYVVIDDQMAGGKFGAIATWTGPGRNTYYQNIRYQFQGQNVTLPAANERYDETMLSQLYFDDASGLSHYRLVHEIDRYSVVGGYIQNGRVNPLTRVGVAGDWDSLRGTANQLETAKRSNQLVQAGSNSYVYRAEVESRVKVYERVEGATITGTAPTVDSATTVFAFVQLQTQDGRNVTYIQESRTDGEGSFAMTVPYATDNAVGPEEGGTNVSVRATGRYSILVGSPFSPSSTGEVQVPEEAIYDGREIQVELETPDDGGSGNQSSGAGNESAGSLEAPSAVGSAGP